MLNLGTINVFYLILCLMLVAQEMCTLLRSINLNINTRYQFNIEHFSVHVSLNFTYLNVYSIQNSSGFLVGQLVKCLPANARDIGDGVESLDQEDPLEEEMATHSSILAWETPWPEEPGRLQSIRSQRVEHNSVHRFVSENSSVCNSVRVYLCQSKLNRIVLQIYCSNVIQRQRYRHTKRDLNSHLKISILSQVKPQKSHYFAFQAPLSTRILQVRITKWAAMPSSRR